MADPSISVVLRDIYEDLMSYSERVAESLAEQASFLLEDEYNYVIERFYNEFTPEYYVRHAERLQPPGLPKTYVRVYGSSYKNYNGSTSDMFGGLELSGINMYQDYNAPPEWVLSSFLNGYHGPPYIGCESSIEPFTHMINYIRFLSNVISNENGEYMKKAKEYAKGFKYKTIKL